MKQPAPVTVLILSAAFFWGCAPKKNAPQNNEASSPEREVTARQVRFLRVYRIPAGDTVYRDSMLLDLQIHGDSASGIYRWVLPEKDGKSGKIRGELFADTVRGHYHYQQEGGTYTDSVEIILGETQAVVTQFTTGDFRLTDTIPAAE
jgi:hypothetical protein